MTPPRLTEIYEEVERQIDHDWNGWPELPIVKVTTYDLNDAKVAFDYGQRYGTAIAFGQARQVPPANLPITVKSLLDDMGWQAWLYSVHVTVRPGLGPIKGSNLHVVFRPRTVGSLNVGLIVELGCDHDTETTQLGNCYRRYTCRKCGYTYTVDSGD